MRILRVLLYITGAGLLLALLSGGGIYYYLTKDLPSLNALYDYRPNLITKAYSHDGQVIGEFYIERRIVVSLSRMPRHLVDAFIAVHSRSPGAFSLPLRGGFQERSARRYWPTG
jgi:penicillin-binding protein 1A